MKRLNDGTIVAGPNDDLCAIVAALQAGGTLAISPGTYNLDRHIVVDKDVTIKSTTNNARDVTIVRAGSTALIVKGGAPKIGYLTFISSPAKDGVFFDNDMIEYKSCVAIRGGSPTLVGCRATSADQSGYSVRGEGVTARLLRCEARMTYDGGIFFDGGASGVIEDCVFADTGLGCVDVEETPVGKCVDVIRTKLFRSEYGTFSVHNGGRVRATECEVSSNLPLGTLAQVHDSLFLARSCHFYSEATVPAGMTLDMVTDHKIKHALAAGVRTAGSKLEFVDCVFERLVTAYATFGKPSALKMTRCKVLDGVESLFIDVKSPAPVFNECEFFKKPIQVDSSEPLDWRPETGDVVENVEKIMLSQLGKAEEILEHCASPIDFGDGETVGYLYPLSEYGGTFVATNQLCFYPNSLASNRRFRAFELATATQLENLAECGLPVVEPLLSRILHPFRRMLEKKRFRNKIHELILTMDLISAYVYHGNIVNRYDTMEFPEDALVPSLAGRCYVFDALSKDISDRPIDPVKVFDYDPEEAHDRSASGSRKEFGFMFPIEITREEMALVWKIGGAKFIDCLKKDGCWPFYRS